MTSIVKKNNKNKLYYYVNYIWRLLATAICFASFGIGSLFLVYVIIPIVGKSKTQNVISTAFRFFVGMVQGLGVLRFEFKNFEKMQSDHGCIIVSNHPTLFDYVLIISRLKKCNTIVKEPLWNNIFMKGIIQLAGYIPNKSIDENFILIKKSLDAGENILIFPEGTRTVPGHPINFKRGAAQLAVRLGAPIRIIKITCNPSTLTKNNKWYNIPKEKALITLEVGELIDSNKFLHDTGMPSLAARHLTEHLQKILLSHTKNVYDNYFFM